MFFKGPTLLNPRVLWLTSQMGKKIWSPPADWVYHCQLPLVIIFPITNNSYNSENQLSQWQKNPNKQLSLLM